MSTLAFILPVQDILPTSEEKIKLSEHELITGMRFGERKAITALYNMYSGSLYGIILRIVKTEEIAEDVLQDTFIKAWKCFDNYDPLKGRLFTWLSNMARNLAIDLLRSKFHRNNAQNESIGDILCLLENTYNVSINIEGIGINQIINTLKPNQKRVLDLIYFSGYTHVEVARKLNIPVGTVKTRLRTGIQNLRKLFG